MLAVTLLLAGCGGDAGGRAPDAAVPADAPVVPDAPAVPDAAVDATPDGAAPDGAPPDGSTPDGPPAYVPSSVELILADNAAGVIDDALAAYYVVLAQFSPARLPPAYYAAVPYWSPPSVTWLRAVRASYDQYTPQQQAAIDAMLSRPDQDGWLDFPAAMPVRPLLRDGTDETGCRSRFAHPAGGTPERHFFGAPDVTTAHFHIRGIVPTAADAAQQDIIAPRLQAALASPVPDVGGGPPVPFADYLDHVFEHYVTTLGMRDPTFALSAPLADGGRIPIDVALCDGPVNDIFAEPNEGWIFASLQAGFEDPDLRRVVIPHELFHLVQAMYDIPGGAGSDWPFEATAVAVEDQLAPDVRRWTGAYAGRNLFPYGVADAFDRLFQCPEEPIHSSAEGGRCIRAPARQRYSGAYSRFALVKFLERNHGFQIPTFWDDYEAAGGFPEGLIPAAQLGELQVALLGDPAAALFDPADRAAFFDPLRPFASPDLPASEPDRYTFRLDPLRAAASVADRVTPTDAFSSARTLPSLATGLAPVGMPLVAGGTHRLLLEVPAAQAAKGEPGVDVDALTLHLEVTGCTSCTLNVVAVDETGGAPGHTLASATSCGATAAPARALQRVACTIPAGTPIPRYLAVLVSNFGAAPVAYQAGLTLGQACVQDCIDHYAAALGAGACGAADLRATLAGGYCPYLCDGTPQSLAQPYCASADPSCQRRENLYGAAGVSTDTIASFVPVTTWPAVTCSDLDCSCAPRPVYVSGRIMVDTTNMHYGALWFQPGGARVELFPDPVGPESATTGVAGLGGDVIVVGGDVDTTGATPVPRAVYWLNDRAHVVALGPGGAGAVAVGGGKVYVGVTAPNGPVSSDAQYYVLGELSPHPLATNAYVSSITVVGGVVYAAGGCTGSSVPCYWKDSGGVVTETLLPNPSGLGSTQSIFVTPAGIVYVAGTQGPTGPGGYWASGGFHGLATLEGTSAGITVLGGDVLVSGTCGSDPYTQQVCLFTNGVRQLLPLPAGTTHCWAAPGLAVDGSDVYVAGFCLDAASNGQSYAWRNGVPLLLGAGLPTGIGTGAP